MQMTKTLSSKHEVLDINNGVFLFPNGDRYEG